MDSGVENLNGDVDKLFEGDVLQRVIAQIDVSYSDSMIEAWVSLCQTSWLFLHQLDNLAMLKKPTEFYVGEHNARMPHSAFQGQPPDEVYFGTGAQVADELAARRRQALTRRLERNREVACNACPRSSPAAGEDVAA